MLAWSFAAGATEHNEHGKGGPASGGASSGASSGSTNSSMLDTKPVQLARAMTETEHAWHVGGFVESHRMIRQTDLQGQAMNKQYQMIGLSLGYDFTERDDIALRGYLYERLLADPGETGLRMDDLMLVYGHRFELPQGYKLRLYGALTAPTSFDSYLMGLITAPRLGLSSSWSTGGLKLTLSGYGEAFIVKYREMAGDGSPNPAAHIAGTLGVEYHTPWLTQLTAGASGALHRTWFYEPHGSTAASGIDVPPTADPQFSSQPVQGSYAVQAYLRYDLPKIAGVETDFTLAYAQGTSQLHDGVTHYYVFYREGSQVFASLAMQY